MSGVSLHAKIAPILQSGLSLDLDSETLTFLAGIHEFLEHNSEPYLQDYRLQEIFRLVNELSQGDPATAQQRGTHAIARLRKQGLLVRGDLGGIAQEGEYGLSQLGKSLAEWVLREESLTRESLEVMMARIRGDLIAIRDVAKMGGSPENWRTGVIAPLRYAVSGVMQMIDRRSRGLSEDQAAVQAKVAALLDAEWFDAIETCEQLLDSVTLTLGEIYRLLMREIDGANLLLGEIHDLAYQCGQNEAVESVEQVRLQMDRLETWGQTRFEAWSGYYRNTHEFIRSHIRIDPDRAFRARLKRGMQETTLNSWRLLVADQDRYTHLREYVELSPQVRPSREIEPTSYDLQPAMIAESEFDHLLDRLREHAEQPEKLDLLEILRQEAGHLDEAAQYALVSRLVPWLLQQGRPEPVLQFDWETVGSHLSIQNLTVVP